MLRSANDIKGYRIGATDGPIGTVRDLYFDDERWAVRYLVVQTDGWLGHDVLISPIAVSAVAWDRHEIDVVLDKAAVKDSPSVDLHQPVSRQDETKYYAYFGFEPYWSGSSLWPSYGAPGLFADETLASIRARRAAQPIQESPGDATESHLRSVSEVIGYHIDATDGTIGHVDDVLVDDRSWAIRFIEVDTSNWIGGESVLVARDALDQVNWPERTLSVSLTRQQVEDGPRAFDLPEQGPA